MEQNASKTKQKPKQVERGKNLKVGIYASKITPVKGGNKMHVKQNRSQNKQEEEKNVKVGTYESKITRVPMRVKLHGLKVGTKCE